MFDRRSTFRYVIQGPQAEREIFNQFRPPTSPIRSDYLRVAETWELPRNTVNRSTQTSDTFYMDDPVNQNPHTQHDAGAEPLTREKRRWHNSTTPINSLPNELLALIFDFGVRIEAEDLSRDKMPKETLYVPLASGAAEEASEEAENGVGDDHDDSDVEDAEKDSGSGSESDEDPSPEYQGIQVLASHVCSRWLECSLSIPTLWTHLDLSGRVPCAKTQEWLTRSKRAPLELNIDFTGLECNDADRSDSEDFFRGRRGVVAALWAVILHSSRWKVLVFHTCDFCLVLLLLRELENNEASILEKLVLRSTGESDGDAIHEAGYGYPKPFACPQLRHLSLRDVYWDWSGKNLGGVNLTLLELEDQDMSPLPTVLEFLAVLVSSPNLEELALKNFGPSPWPRWTVIVDGCERGPPIHTNPHIKVQPVLLPQLEKLSLSSHCDTSWTNRTINLIQAPALLKLTLKDLRPNPPESDLRDIIWTIASNADISQHTPWGEVQLALLSPRFPRLEELSIEKVPCRSLVAHWCMFHSFRSLKRLHIVLDGHLRFAPSEEASLLHCFLDPSLTTYSLSEREKEQHRWLDHEFGTPCPLLEEFQCSGVPTSTLMAVARRRNEIGSRLRMMRFHVGDRFTEAELDGLYSLVDNLVECEMPGDWEELETPSGSGESEGSEMDDDHRHEFDEHGGGADGGEGDTSESGDSE